MDDPMSATPIQSGQWDYINQTQAEFKQEDSYRPSIEERSQDVIDSAQMTGVYDSSLPSKLAEDTVGTGT